MATTTAHTHASLRRAASPSSDSTTGEVRVLLSLYQVDALLGDVDLVLSRHEGEQLIEQLQAGLAVQADTARARRPEVVR